MSERGYGWIPSRPDARDYVWNLEEIEEEFKPIPKEKSLRDKMPPVYDQGSLGSCTANAIGAAVEFQQMKEPKKYPNAVTPSRLFIYYEERALEGTIDSDAGAVIRDGMKVIKNSGAPPETDWPYDISKFTNKPSSQAYQDALKHTGTYGRVIQSEHSLMNSITYNRPVVFGFTVYESFEYDISSDGIMPMPDIKNEQVMGGHAVMIVGFKPINGKLYFEVRNSWSDSWGDNGYFWMPSEFATSPSFCSDFWHIDKEA